MLRAADTLGLEETRSALDAKRLSKDAHVGRNEVLRALLGTSVGLLLTEGASNAL